MVLCKRWKCTIRQLVVVLGATAAIWNAVPDLKAQDLPAPPATGAAGQGANIFQVTAENLASLPGVLAQGRADAVSLGVTLDELDANPQASGAILRWVASGGVVFLHSDAAQLFGYSTRPARAATARQAGQLYGRARAALSFGAHPLLWGSVADARQAGGAATMPSGQSGRSTLGVRLVFYRLQAGDHLVTEHPSGVPLLRVTDLAAPAGAETLYAAAIAPFGSGWALFVPDLIETHRADGAVFLRNIMRVVASSRAARAGLAAANAANDGAAPATQLPPLAANPTGNAGGALVSLPAAAIEQLSTGGAGTFRTLSQICYQALAPANAGGEPRAATVNGGLGPRLILTRGETQRLAVLAGSAATEAGLVPAATAMLWTLRARLELQRDDLTAAGRWIERSLEAAPRAAETLLWAGNVSAARAEDLSFGSRERAALYAQAAQDWRAAGAAPALLSPASAAQSTSDGAGAAGAANISGVPGTLVQAWSRVASETANLMGAEPPLVTPLGNRLGTIWLRHFPDDPTLRLALPTGVALTNSLQVFGWRPDQEEILIFPTPQYFQTYRQAARLGAETRTNPLQNFGDLVGNRILMVSQITLQIFLPPIRPGDRPRPVQLGSAVPAVIGRLHGMALVNTLSEGGTPVPAWMVLGITSLSNQNVVGNALASNGVLLPVDQAGALLTPRQFEAVPLGRDVQGIAEVQAQRLMTYFYQRFGAGRVAETLQRLGARESVDDALQATTGLNEQEFFVSWRNAEFGTGRRNRR